MSLILTTDNEDDEEQDDERCFDVNLVVVFIFIFLFAHTCRCNVVVPILAESNEYVDLHSLHDAKPLII
jgi:hypothetical protein